MAPPATPPAKHPVARVARPFLYWLFHSCRLFGYAAWGPVLLKFQPKLVLTALVAYATVMHQKWWQQLCHQALGLGASRRHRIVNEVPEQIDPKRKYLWCLHPHSVLMDGWHSLIAADPTAFEGPTGPTEIGRPIKLCFAPIIKRVPVHQEMYRERCGSADAKSIVECFKTDVDPALAPGGFSESVFANSAEKEVEYAYLKGRSGFVRLAIQNKVDIVPTYSFRASRMYYNPSVLRGARARFSQQYFAGLVMPMGWLGTAMPLTDRTTTVVFPPFPTSQYTEDQVWDAHAAYLVHLKHWFDHYKERFGMRGVRLEFVGKDFVDEDPLARVLRATGIMKAEKPAPLVQSKL
mmetsp:Transcript_51581/g.110580  ORF Transcript_51581/g.110580 Transcript_51581/m.110580 type:complete len:350 (+) Transcript_51581:51-1100(+)